MDPAYAFPSKNNFSQSREGLQKAVDVFASLHFSLRLREDDFVFLALSALLIGNPLRTEAWNPTLDEPRYRDSQRSTDNSMPRNFIDAVQGTLELLVLQTLVQGELHGYAIARWIAERSSEELRVEEGTLYPALHRMEERNWIAARWGVSELGRRAKFYRLTAAGRKELRERAESWDRATKAVRAVMKAGRHG
jgi:transcriptional regulator